MISRKKILKFFLFGADLILVYATLILALAIRYGDFSFWPGPLTQDFVFHFLFLGPLWILFLYLLDFYKIPPIKDYFNFFYNLAAFPLLAGATGAIYFYLQSQPYLNPKTILALHIFLFTAGVGSCRFLVFKTLNLLGVKERIILVGPALDFSHRRLNWAGFKLIKRFDLNSLKISQLKKWAWRADSIVFNPRFFKQQHLVRKVFEELPLKMNFMSFSDFYEEISNKIPLDEIDEAWFLTDFSQSQAKIDQIAKRSFDVFFSLIGLFITALLFPLVALAIKLDSKGPIFYCQKRVGKDGDVFRLCKFRTMKDHPRSKDRVWREKEKGQVTKIGRILRRFEIDEFPEFWSILKGDLSFVGPRPEWVKLAKRFEKEIPFYKKRYLVKPGFTGWAQINYPASTSVEEAREKFEYDLYYIKNRSFLLDLSIILKTIRVVFRKYESTATSTKN